jgi:hypothetical protein
MNDFETAEKAETFFGDKLYQQRARAALPLLVRQAKAQKTIFYADLAEELGMSNPRNLNFVLGSVGRSIFQLSKERGEEIPPIQSLVVNQTDGLPGEGIIFFIKKEEYQGMSKRQRRIVVEAQLQKIFAYPNWDSILAAFSMQPVTSDFSTAVRKAAAFGRGGGESEHHIRLKQHVAANPSLVGLSAGIAPGVNEYGLPSGDELDVLFRAGNEWIAVEVKSHISSDDDLVRGFFQCVKYQAVLEAFLTSTDRPPDVRTILVIERELPAELIPLRNLLGIEVVCAKTPIIDAQPLST